MNNNPYDFFLVMNNDPYGEKMMNNDPYHAYEEQKL